jgi:hypothetical protein
MIMTTGSSKDLFHDSDRTFNLSHYTFSSSIGTSQLPSGHYEASTLLCRKKVLPRHGQLNEEMTSIPSIKSRPGQTLFSRLDNN